MKSFVKWLDTHAGAIQALSAMLTVVIATGALIGVKLQINASERVQREQSARDIYREYLNLSISRPEFSSPNYCGLLGTPQIAAYQDYVEYLFFTAEQLIGTDAQWEAVFLDDLRAHGDYVCSVTDWSLYAESVRRLSTRFQAASCGKPVVCPSLASQKP